MKLFLVKSGPSDRHYDNITVSFFFLYGCEILSLSEGIQQTFKKICGLEKRG